MTRLRVLPHADSCPQGAIIDAEPGKSICDALLDAGINIEHACEKACACTTCHVIIRAGFETLTPAEDKEEDLLDKAWGARTDLAPELPGARRAAGARHRDPQIHH